jgi:hypothetical protein
MDVRKSNTYIRHPLILHSQSKLFNSIMDITLYEMGTSRSLRCRWTLKEIGLEYKSIDDRSSLRSNELKKIHPLGKMPAALIDGMPLLSHQQYVITL